MFFIQIFLDTIIIRRVSSLQLSFLRRYRTLVNAAVSCLGWTWGYTVKRRSCRGENKRLIFFFFLLQSFDLLPYIA
jgi:hypothetical protein